MCTSSPGRYKYYGVLYLHVNILRLIHVKGLIQDHSGRKCWSWNLNPPMALNNYVGLKPTAFPVIIHRCERWTIKKAECQRTDAFKPWCWRRFLRVPWTARRSNQSILKEINSEYSLEGLLLKLKLQYYGYLTQRANSMKTPWSWERLKAKGAAEDTMVT